MILPFKQIANGKPTNFREKILGSVEGQRMKIHTLRGDEKNRIRPGSKLHCTYNSRQANMEVFADLRCKSTERVQIHCHKDGGVRIFINTIQELIGDEKLEFAWNDGFDTLEDFYNWFYPAGEEFNKFVRIWDGKVIHWTGKRYSFAVLPSETYTERTHYYEFFDCSEKGGGKLVYLHEGTEDESHTCEDVVLHKLMDRAYKVERRVTTPLDYRIEKR